MNIKGFNISKTDTVYFSGISADIFKGNKSSLLTLMTLSIEKNMGAPLHRSIKEEKVFHVTSGQVYFKVGFEEFTANVGDFVFVGKGEPHSFCGLTDKPSTMNLVSTPALHHQFFKEMSQLSVPHSPEKVSFICRKYRQEIVGPTVEPLNQ